MGSSPGLAPKPGLKPRLDRRRVRSLAGFAVRAALFAGSCLAWWASGTLHKLGFTPPCPAGRYKWAVNQLQWNIGSLPQPWLHGLLSLLPSLREGLYWERNTADGPAVGWSTAPSLGQRAAAWVRCRSAQSWGAGCNSGYNFSSTAVNACRDIEVIEFGCGQQGRAGCVFQHRFAGLRHLHCYQSHFSHSLCRPAFC